MPWPVHDKEFENVLKLPMPNRYAYVCGKFGDWREIWGLKDSSGWTIVGCENGRKGFPVWPHPRFAEACANGQWAGRKPGLISFNNWMTKWLPGMTKDNVYVIVFMLPNSDNTGIVVEPSEHRAHLINELSKYGEDESDLVDESSEE